ncbi:PREDICTED: lysosomal acid lipase/cholesteryl ester hydrolase-like [Gekko japonicus]|uniref:Lipase n=1 Tax=Gekko japonicus TaxID=146911 RepID=A0ABM1L2C1_GEKJA|nr:PREDICTED: lysosomal acid lipase/cholesteryl ester hydrolase-like [Gekko japonicus]
MAWMVHIHGSRIWLAVAVINLIQQSTHSELSGRHLNPETFMTIPEIIQFWGYPSEQYEVQTDDGYFLQLNRIPYGLHSPGKKGHNPAVLLVSGVVTDSKCWILNPPNNSIGFALADAGYDVWMINCRGTTWSRRHQNLSIEQEEFWDFSFHEMGIYDIPAAMKFILMKTKQETLYYIGHSQGASLGLIAFSLLPEFAQKVKLLMLFAPTYTMAGTWNPSMLILFLPDAFKRSIWGRKEFCPLPRKMKILNAELCSYAIIDKICAEIFAMGFGDNKKNLNLSRIDVYAGMFPDYTSVKTIVHWGQVAKSREFKYFDYDSENKAVYNMTTPPFYKVEDVTVPTAVWSAGKDIITDLKDIELLLPQLTHLIFYKNNPSWQHTDFVTGLDAPEYLYPDMFRLMEQYK